MKMNMDRVCILEHIVRRRQIAEVWYRPHFKPCVALIRPVRHLWHFADRFRSKKEIGLHSCGGIGSRPRHFLTTCNTILRLRALLKTANTRSAAVAVYRAQEAWRILLCTLQCVPATLRSQRHCTCNHVHHVNESCERLHESSHKRADAQHPSQHHPHTR